MIVATAVLIAWLLVELTRLALGDLRLPRLHQGSLQGAPSGPSPIQHNPPSRGAGEASPPTAEAEPSADQRILFDEADVERAIRDRLYGGRGRRRA